MNTVNWLKKVKVIHNSKLVNKTDYNARIKNRWVY